MKRAIFVRSKTIVMTELDKKIREKEIYRVTLVGSFVNFLLVIFKFLAGIAGHSAAMLADAVPEKSQPDRSLLWNLPDICSYNRRSPASVRSR